MNQDFFTDEPASSKYKVFPPLSKFLSGSTNFGQISQKLHLNHKEKRKQRPENRGFWRLECLETFAWRVKKTPADCFLGAECGRPRPQQ
jgi:hypothetical protein